MITIRYAELPEGLYAQAEASGKHTVIYLCPGLTPEQRSRGLRRARQTARMGYGPRLPATGVAMAVAHDAMRNTLLDTVAAVRTHVVGSTLLSAAVVTVLVCCAMFGAAPMRVVVPRESRLGFIQPPHAAAGVGGSSPSAARPRCGHHLTHHLGRRLSCPVRPARGYGDRGAPRRTSSPRARRSPSPSPAPSPSPSRVSPSPTPAPPPSPSLAGRCLLAGCS